jgi:hypothetical protein
MIERKSKLFFVYLLVSTLLMCLMFIHATVRRNLEVPLLRERGVVVRVLALTDLCLFTEARYTRHPSMADLNTPFQDYPMSLEHFPSGSIMTVPHHLKPRAPK